MIHVERYGTGTRAYAALHGWGGSHRTYAPLAPYVPESAALYAIDLPGYGLTPRTTAASAAEIGGIIAAALAPLPSPPLTLVGNCSGAIFALLAASAPGSPVTRLVLIDPFAFVPWYFKVFINPTYGRYAYYSTFANPLGRWVTNASLRRRRAATSNLTGSFRHVDHEVSLQYLSLLDAVGSIEAFRGVGVPTEIAYGERTFGAVRASLAGWSEVLPQTRLWKIARAGHLPIEEAPAQIAAIVFGDTASAGRVR